MGEEVLTVGVADRGLGELPYAKPVARTRRLRVYEIKSSCHCLFLTAH